MTRSPEAALEDVLSSNARVFLACTGAGAGLQGLLWSRPGASKFFVGAAFPYAHAAIDAFLGFSPERYTSPEAAVDLALESFLRAGASEHAVGIGVTGTVASLEVHRADHRVHAAWVSHASTGSFDVVLPKGTGADVRIADGALADRLGLNALLAAIDKPVLGTTPEATREDRAELLRERLFARPLFLADGRRAEAPSSLLAAFPGTFNPPHQGHGGMADAYRALSGRSPVFWITAEPPHKAPVPAPELLRRRALLAGRDVLFTRGEPLYLDKARRYPGCAFVVGTDAVVRMLDPKWGPNPQELFTEFRALGTRFYVTNRVDGETLVSLGDVSGAPTDLFFPLPGRWDVSSTELRKRESAPLLES